MKIVVTGAKGFVGSALMDVLRKRGHRVIGVSHRISHTESNVVCVNNFQDGDSWAPVLDGADVVVHLAARAHIMDDRQQDPLEAFRAVNVLGTRVLAEASVQHSVGRFVYISSIKVNGERTQARAFTEDDEPQPEDPYAISKWEAEQALLQISESSDMSLVRVRPPLIYGPDVKGNLLQLLKWVHAGIPLPFGRIRNRRSLLGLNNFVDFLSCCVEHRDAAGELFLVADNVSLSTAELVREMVLYSSGKSRVLNVPPSLLKAAFFLTGQVERGRRLLESLEVDAGKSRQLLGWMPPTDVHTGLQDMVTSYEAGLVG